MEAIQTQQTVSPMETQTASPTDPVVQDQSTIQTKTDWTAEQHDLYKMLPKEWKEICDKTPSMIAFFQRMKELILRDIVKKGKTVSSDEETTE